MARLLLVHHTSSPGLQAMFEAVVSGTAAEGIQGVEVEVRPALTAAAHDVLTADGYLLGTQVHAVLDTLCSFRVLEGLVSCRTPDARPRWGDGLTGTTLPVSAERRHAGRTTQVRQQPGLLDQFRSCLVLGDP